MDKLFRGEARSAINSPSIDLEKLKKMAREGLVNNEDIMLAAELGNKSALAYLGAKRSAKIPLIKSENIDDQEKWTQDVLKKIGAKKYFRAACRYLKERVRRNNVVEFQEAVTYIERVLDGEVEYDEVCKEKLSLLTELKMSPPGTYLKAATTLLIRGVFDFVDGFESGEYESVRSWFGAFHLHLLNDLNGGNNASLETKYTQQQYRDFADHFNEYLSAEVLKGALVNDKKVDLMRADAKEDLKKKMNKLNIG